jgi:hypothetical protein
MSPPARALPWKRTGRWPQFSLDIQGPTLGFFGLRPAEISTRCLNSIKGFARFV